MKRIFSKSVVGLGVLLIGMAAQSVQAQVYDGRGYNGNPQRGYPPQGAYNGPSREYALFDQVQGDLNRAAAFGYVRGGQRRQLQKASNDLANFERRWSQGRFDRHELDEAIGRIQGAINHSGLTYRDRAALQEDVERMRQFRAYEGGNAYGYRR